MAYPTPGPCALEGEENEVTKLTGLLPVKTA